MNFLKNFKQQAAQFMQGRYGQDDFGKFLTTVALIGVILNMLLRSGFLSLVILAVLAYSVFRMFSRDKEKRWAENQKFLAWWKPNKVKAMQAVNRFKNRKQYKYFKCPQCKAWLRLPHGSGTVNVTCGRCQNRFTYKA